MGEKWGNVVESGGNTEKVGNGGGIGAQQTPIAVKGKVRKANEVMSQANRVFNGALSESAFHCIIKSDKHHTQNEAGAAFVTAT